VSEIGDRIRSHREATGRTQQELAAELGISKSYLNHIEAGRRNASPRLLELIFNLLDMDEAKMHVFRVLIQAEDLDTPVMGVTIQAVNFRAALRSAAELPTASWSEVEGEV
jgi:transcriptional regulator with XRE-family HTH domain